MKKTIQTIVLAALCLFLSSAARAQTAALKIGDKVPDMTINKSTPVTLAIQAKNIPLGTQINVSLFSESGEDQLLTSTPLSGTVAASVAEASGTLPPGFSRVFVRASWTPAP